MGCDEGCVCVCLPSAVVSSVALIFLGAAAHMPVREHVFLGQHVSPKAAGSPSSLPQNQKSAHPRIKPQPTTLSRAYNTARSRYIKDRDARRRETKKKSAVSGVCGSATRERDKRITSNEKHKERGLRLNPHVLFSNFPLITCTCHICRPQAWWSGAYSLSGHRRHETSR
eukprot:scaffold23_cov113-Isochrysis_galbana.AAC.6